MNKSPLLPEWLPEWNGAQEIVDKVDVVDLRRRVRELLGLVFTEDTVLLDSLGDELESALVSPLGTLAEIYEAKASDVDLVVACRLVRGAAIPYVAAAPEKLRKLIEELPE